MTKSEIDNKRKRKVILVDHNEMEQSASGLEEADITEIVDHHKIGSIGTTLPINFRNMPVGSTNTIIYTLYLENKIEIPKDIAQIMLSGILSDTLILNSPTTTIDDIEAVKKLSKIAEIDYKKYGLEMLQKGSDLKGKTIDELIYNDFKIYEENHYKIGLGQILTIDTSDIINKKIGECRFTDFLNKNRRYCDGFPK